MKKTEFFEKLKDAIETESNIDENTNLKALNEYSSLTTLSIIVLIDELFEKSLTARELNSVNSINELMELIGMDKFKS